MEPYPWRRWSSLVTGDLWLILVIVSRILGICAVGSVLPTLNVEQ